MAYFSDVSSPETWGEFLRTDGTVTGFEEKYRRIATEQVKQGDIFICYIKVLSSWCGVLQVDSDAYHDSTRRFVNRALDPYTVRFKVKPIVVLEPERAIPIKNESVWNTLSFTRDIELGRGGWSWFFRPTLRRFQEEDGKYLVDLLTGQLSGQDTDVRESIRQHAQQILDLTEQLREG